MAAVYPMGPVGPYTTPWGTIRVPVQHVRAGR